MRRYPSPRGPVSSSLASGVKIMPGLIVLTRAPRLPHTRYRRIASRRGPQKANVAVQHSMPIAIWHMGTNGCLYDDPGADYFSRLHPDRAKKRAINQLEAMGYQVTLTHAS
jgi:hypothetical protein